MSKKKLLKGIEPDPRLDAVLGAGARGNYYRSNSIYRDLIVKHTDNYSKVSATNFRLKRLFVTQHVITPILNQGGRFLAIEKHASAEAAKHFSAADRGLSSSTHGTCYYELNLKVQDDMKVVIKAIQQAMRDEIKARVRKARKEAEKLAEASGNPAANPTCRVLSKQELLALDSKKYAERFADAPEDDSAFTKPASFPGAVNLTSPITIGKARMGIRKKATPAQRKSKGLVLPTRRKNLLPLNRRCDTEKVQQGTPSVPPPAAHIPKFSTLLPKPTESSNTGISHQTNDQLVHDGNDSFKSATTPALLQKERQPVATSMIENYSNGVIPGAATANHNHISHVNMANSQQPASWIGHPPRAHTVSQVTQRLHQHPQQHYYTPHTMPSNNNNESHHQRRDNRDVGMNDRATELQQQQLKLQLQLQQRRQKIQQQHFLLHQEQLQQQEQIQIQQRTLREQQKLIEHQNNLLSLQKSLSAAVATKEANVPNSLHIGNGFTVNSGGASPIVTSEGPKKEDDDDDDENDDDDYLFL